MSHEVERCSRVFPFSSRCLCSVSVWISRWLQLKRPPIPGRALPLLFKPHNCRSPQHTTDRILQLNSLARHWSLGTGLARTATGTNTGTPRRKKTSSNERLNSLKLQKSSLRQELDKLEGPKHAARRAELRREEAASASKGSAGSGGAAERGRGERRDRG